MRSIRIGANTVGTPNQYNGLVSDAAGSARLLAHQMLGYFTLSTNPTNPNTLTLDINGTNVVITFVSSIGSTPGNVLIGASAAATCANLLSLLQNPIVSNANQIAIGTNTSANVTLVNYLSYSLVGTTLVISSLNNLTNAPLTSFSGSTTATSDSYTASTLTLYVEPGVVYINGTEVYFAGGVSPTATAPASLPRIDVLTMDPTGTLNWTTGTEASSPSVPTYPANQIPICELYNVVSETHLLDNANQSSGQGYILNDVRPFLAYPLPIGAIPDNVLPSANATYNLGSSSYQWENLYISSNVFVNGLAMAGHFGGTGADGALTATSGTTTISAGSAAYLIKNYTSISITSTAYVQFTTPHANGTIIQIKSQGNVTLTSSAAPMLDASGMGGAGGTNGTTGAGTSGNAAHSNFTNATASLGVAGANGTGGAGGTTLSLLVTGVILGKIIPLICGAGGGSGYGGGASTGNGGAGGAGGGALYIECGGNWNFTTASGISVKGIVGTAGTLDGGGGGGGGGGGMLVVLYAALTANTGTVTTAAGAGGAGANSAGAPYGGGGGGGASIANNGTVGGSTDTAQGGGAGGAGTSFIAANVDFS